MKLQEESQYDDQGNAKHYQESRIGTLDMMIKVWGIEATRNYCEMTAFKYRMRMGHKPGQPLAQELLKANWYEKKSKELTKKMEVSL